MWLHAGDTNFYYMSKIGQLGWRHTGRGRNPLRVAWRLQAQAGSTVGKCARNSAGLTWRACRTGSDEAVSPAFLIQIGGPVVERTEDATRAIHLHQLAMGDANLGILIEQGHKRESKVCSAESSASAIQIYFPRASRTSRFHCLNALPAIDGVASNPDAAVFQKRCDDSVTVISRSIIQIDDLKIMEGPGERALDLSPQELGMIVIGDDESDLVHGYVALSVAAWTLRSSQHGYD